MSKITVDFSKTLGEIKPINGVGNNMNASDAADFAYEIDAKCAIPLHYGLFDDINPETFDFEDKILLNPFEETVL